jgi:hypothetical protein
MDLRAASHQFCKEPAIAVPIHEHALKGGHFREAQAPALLQIWTKAEVFHPAVSACQTVEGGQ